MSTPPPSKPASSLTAMLWPCALYFTCAFAMNMLTKLLLATHRWPALCALGAVQNAFTTVSVGALLLVRRLLHGGGGGKSSSSSSVAGGGGDAVSTPPSASITSDSRLTYSLRVLLPLVALHVGNMLLGFAAMRVVNMPMYLVLRRLTTLKVMLIEWLVLRKETTSGTKLALLLSTLGSVVAGGTDTTSDLAGYVLVLLQNVCSALSLTFSKESTLSPVELVLLSSAAGCVICSLLALRFEIDAVLAFPKLYDPQFLLTLGIMCCVCVLYQFSIFICTIRNSALATSVTGNVKDLVSTVCGFLFFTDAPVHASNLAGVVLSFIGAYSFSYLKYLAFTQQAAQVQAAAQRAGATRLETKPKQA